MRLTRFIIMFVAACVAMGAHAAKTIKVKTAQEFIKALGSERTIVIATDKPINLTDELDKMVARGEIVRGQDYSVDHGNGLSCTLSYTPNFDGNGLQVRNCIDLTIKAGSKKGATLLVSPRYVNVLEFIACADLTLENITMGHTTGGYCDKGVLELDQCVNVTINDCDFFGCGTEGFKFVDCNDVVVNRSTVHDCTYHTMHVRNSGNIRFNECIFRDNKEFEQVSVSGSEDVIFTRCNFVNLQGPLFNLANLVQFNSCSFYNCQLPPLEGLDNWFTSDNAIMAYCNYLDVEPETPSAVNRPSLKVGYWTDGMNNYTVSKLDDYCYEFTSIAAQESFTLHCISAVGNEYMTGPGSGFEFKLGRMPARVNTEDGKPTLIILDDGHEYLKSFTFKKKF